MASNPTFPPSRPLVHGHRGCRGLRPENTLPAFLHALQLGVDVLELDVVLSADGQVVVSHEPWFSAAFCLTPAGERIAPGQEQQHNLYQLSYDVIRRYDCGQLQHPGFPQQQAQPAYKPLLREVLASVEAAAQQLGRPPVAYSVEVKSAPEFDNVFQPEPTVFLPLVLVELQAAQVMARSTLLSFDLRILQLSQLLSPSLPTCLLTETAEPWPRTIQRLGFVPAVLGPDFTLASPAAIAELRALHPTVSVVPWTVNEAEDLQRVLGWGVEGITTDYPDRLLRLLAG
ncbi:glycerophosphodiester phosphodiesterase family protein [Hymenobacter saemangeumensis]|uniref:Glycerophosphodiester phosphodiesterase family protein n=1 Tax=Hymenobacter saemangeumensis TaxID=1084522 RepID=A0ABP8I5F3_9BACT